MTDCEECRRFEAPLPTRASIARDMLVAGLFRLPLFRPSPASQMISNMGMMMALTLGSAIQEPTWYEKHRQAWIETGDLAELDRMLRHPLPPPPRPMPVPARRMILAIPAVTVPLAAVAAIMALIFTIWFVHLGWPW